MKRKFLYFAALICVAGIFTSCEKESAPTHEWAKTYSLADYKVTQEKLEDGSENQICTQGAGYVNFVCVLDGMNYGSYSNIFRTMFGAILPQTLKSITLGDNGSISAEYVAKPAIKFEPMWAFMAPDVKTVTDLIPAGGWIKSPTNFATWSDKGGKLLLKLNLDEIMTNEGVSKDKIELIKSILKMSPADIKNMLKEMGVVVNISDESINQLLGWVNNGILLNYKKEGSSVKIFLDKNDFDSLFKMRKVTVDNVKKDMSDIMVIWEILTVSEIIPAEAAMAGAFINGMSMGWEVATACDMGLDLQLAK